MTAALLALATGCSSEPDPADVEALADLARGHIDDLAAELGRDPEVKQDVITDCVPGRTDSGKELIYTLWVTTEPGVRQRLLGDVREDYEANGWTVKTGGASDLRMARESITMGVTVSRDGTAAAVSGSGGCLD